MEEPWRPTPKAPPDLTRLSVSGQKHAWIRNQRFFDYRQPLLDYMKRILNSLGSINRDDERCLNGEIQEICKSLGTETSLDSHRAEFNEHSRIPLGQTDNSWRQLKYHQRNRNLEAHQDESAHPWNPKQ